MPVILDKLIKTLSFSYKTLSFSKICDIIAVIFYLHFKVLMNDYEEWKEEEKSLIPEDWTDEDIAWWNNFLPVLKEALFLSSKKEIKEIEALPDIEIEFIDDFKKGINKIFRDAFGADCKVPHPEIEVK